MNRRLIILFYFLFYLFPGFGQLTTGTEQLLESLAERDGYEKEDDNYLQDLEQFKKDPLDINAATPDELRVLQHLNDLQIESLVSYRRLIGDLISIYELQAVPAWDLATIKKILPFIKLGSGSLVTVNLKQRFGAGDHFVVIRLSQTLEKAKGFQQPENTSGYRGARLSSYIRYNYNYKQLLQFGLVCEKDAGEQFFKGGQRSGFDFYSIHFYLRKLGRIQDLALGDFTVNLGQGLIQWQSLAFKKSADVIAIKRQSSMLKPYRSVGEFNFFRGAGITVQKNKFQASLFASVRKLSANMEVDSVTGVTIVKAVLTSGYHRTATENAQRNRLSRFCFGGNAMVKYKNGHVGLNGIYTINSAIMEKRPEPYNLYAISGKSWWNYSVDYSYTHKNVHLFGEIASDRYSHFAFLHGMLISVDPAVDLALLYRNLSPKFQAVNGNAFTENTYPANESGIYTGIIVRGGKGWLMKAYADLYKFPWLKYRVDAPGNGKDFLLLLQWTVSKQSTLTCRYRNEIRHPGQKDELAGYFSSSSKQSCRVDWQFQVSPGVVVQNRSEMIWWEQEGQKSEQGFLNYVDVQFKPRLKPYSISTRFQYFESGGGNTLLYAYERDVLYSYSIPVFSGRGLRYYFNISHDLGQKISIWCRWSQTFYLDQTGVGSGLDALSGNQQSEIRLQVRWTF